jgi:hypothetical protein
MASLSCYLKTEAKMQSDKIDLKQGATLKQQEELEKQAADYFFPYKSFIAHYGQKAIKVVTLRIQH